MYAAMLLQLVAELVCAVPLESVIDTVYESFDVDKFGSDDCTDDTTVAHGSVSSPASAPSNCAAVEVAFPICCRKYRPSENEAVPVKTIRNKGSVTANSSNDAPSSPPRPKKRDSLQTHE